MKVKLYRADWRHVVETEFDDAQYVGVADFNHILAERDALQQRLNAVEDENDRLCIRALPENWKDLLIEEMERRFELSKREHDYMCVDDTQIGVEFAADWMKKRLIAHADAGEVEHWKRMFEQRCQEVIEESTKAIEAWREITTLRAQLAERDALLRDRFGGIRKLAEQACGRPKDSPEYRALFAAITPTMLLDLTALSASAEPSAPVEHDHDALVAAVCVLRSQGLGNLSEAVEAARAALDRK